MSIIETPSPTTWTDGTLLTQALLNGEIRDPLRFLASGCSCVVSLSSGQSIPNNSNTDVSFDTQVTDTDGIISVPSSTFTFTRAGVIALRFYGTFGTATGGSVRHFKGLIDTGSGFGDFCGVSDSPSTAASLQAGLCLSVDFPVLEGYSFKIQAFQNSGSSLNVNANKTLASLTWVGKTVDQTDYDVPVSDDPAPSPPPTTSTPTKHTRTYKATWSRSYDGDNGTTWDDSKFCYQGKYDYNRGNTKSLVGFDYSTIKSDLSGAQKVEMHLGFYCSHSYYNSGLTAIIGGHHYSSKPSTWSDASVYQNIQRTHANKNQKTYIQLNSTMVSNIKSGKYRGIAFGPGPSTSKQYYGYFNGATQGSKPYLYVTYYK